MVVHIAPANRSVITSNSAVLAGAYAIIRGNCEARHIWALLKPLGPYATFRDAGYIPIAYKCTVEDCLLAIERAISLQWFDYPTFNVKEYELR
jgi:hypothetical protein